MESKTFSPQKCKWLYNQFFVHKKKMQPITHVIHIQFIHLWIAWNNFINRYKLEMLIVSHCMRSWNCRRPSWLHYDFRAISNWHSCLVYRLGVFYWLECEQWTTTNEWSDKSKWNTIKSHRAYTMRTYIGTVLFHLFHLFHCIHLEMILFICAHFVSISVLYSNILLRFYFHYTYRHANKQFCAFRNWVTRQRETRRKNI